MEDEEYQHMEDALRPTAHGVLSAMLNEEATKAAQAISHDAAISIQARTRGNISREAHDDAVAEMLSERLMHEWML